MKGLIHIYEGDGKGKTTAAIGLAVRCAGSGGKVLLTQFLKSNQSSEMNILKQIAFIEVVLSEADFGFSWNMSDETKDRARVANDKLLLKVMDQAKSGEYRLLILDEIVDAYNLKLIHQEMLIEFLKDKPEELEVVMTGRNPAIELVELADYISDMRKIKHPYDQGTKARKGIES